MRARTLAAAAAAAFLLVGSVPSAGAAGAPVYPNLKTLPPDHLSFDTVTLADGLPHVVLRFGNTAWNSGEGPLELRAEPLDIDTATAYQRILDANGQLVSERVIGQFIFHPQHNHYHLEDFALYQLWTRSGYDAWVASGGTSGAPMAVSTKVTFCLEDGLRLAPTLPGSPAQPAYTICSQTGLSGISVGWADWYPAYLYGQWVDPGQAPLADGNYVVRSVADPDNLIWESPNGADQSRESRADNQAITPFRVTGGVIYEQLLTDGFESGLGAWPKHPGVTVQSGNAFSGTAAARAAAGGSPAYLSHDILLGRNMVRLDARFDLVSQSTRAGIAAVKTSAGRMIGIVFVGAGGMLGFKDAITGVTTMSTRKVSRGAWHRLELQLSVGAVGRVQISLDGVSALDLSGDLGSTQTGRLLLGDTASGRTFVELFDDVVVEGS
jgi:hypothetical protein